MTAPDRDVVLLGIGHTNAHVLARWRKAPPPGARLTCVSALPVAVYSGMLPGVLAGQYPPAAMEIDLARLCAAAGARLIVGDAVGLDAGHRRLVLRDRPALRFDALSVGIGSVPSLAGVAVDDDRTLVAAKPMQTFLTRLTTRLDGVGQTDATGVLRLAVVGGGAAGVELALSLPAFVRHRSGPRPVATVLVTGGAEVLEGSLPGTVIRARAALRRAGVVVSTGRHVVRVHDRGVALDDGTAIDADLVVWVTNAVGPPLLRALGLPTDDRGFLRTAATLRSTSGAPVFAVGDAGTVEGVHGPKSGVVAVRQGPVLWQNLLATLEGAPLVPYVPQRSHLQLLNTADGRAIGEWRGWSFEGRLAWRLKDWIDRDFMARYRADGLEPSAPAAAGPRKRG